MLSQDRITHSLAIVDLESMLHLVFVKVTVGAK